MIELEILESAIDGTLKEYIMGFVPDNLLKEAFLNVSFEGEESISAHLVKDYVFLTKEQEILLDMLGDLLNLEFIFKVEMSKAGDEPVLFIKNWDLDYIGPSEEDLAFFRKQERQDFENVMALERARGN